MKLLIDTTKEHIGELLIDELEWQGKKGDEYQLVEAGDMNISHCAGCNFCWLKTPGVCVIKDDYEDIMKKMIQADQVWLIADTKFGFVDYKAKNIMDRVMPLVTMNLEFRDKQMRHIMRYDTQPDWGIIYTGEGDQQYLENWCERVAVNFGSDMVGVFDSSRMKEAAACM